jgi:phenylpropionate dioxygenase-like ring-hydroxylating dioxygenase large terminal subunit
MPADFDCKAISLPSFPVETWGGFVYVNLDAHATSLARAHLPLAGAVGALPHRAHVAR